MGKKGRGRKQNSIKETASRTTAAAEEVNALTQESRMRPEAAVRTGGLLSETRDTVQHRATRFCFESDEAANDPEMQRYLSRMTALSCKDWVDWDNPDVGAITRAIATEYSHEYFDEQERQLNALKAIIEQQNRIGDFEKTVGLLDQAMLMTADRFLRPRPAMIYTWDLATHMNTWECLQRASRCMSSSLKRHEWREIRWSNDML